MSNFFVMFCQLIVWAIASCSGNASVFYEDTFFRLSKEEIKKVADRKNWECLYNWSISNKITKYYLLSFAAVWQIKKYLKWILNNINTILYLLWLLIFQILRLQAQYDIELWFYKYASITAHCQFWAKRRIWIYIMQKWILFNKKYLIKYVYK